MSNITSCLIGVLVLSCVRVCFRFNFIFRIFFNICQSTTFNKQGGWWIMRAWFNIGEILPYPWYLSLASSSIMFRIKLKSCDKGLSRLQSMLVLPQASFNRIAWASWKVSKYLSSPLKPLLTQCLLSVCGKLSSFILKIQDKRNGWIVLMRGSEMREYETWNVPLPTSNPFLNKRDFSSSLRGKGTTAFDRGMFASFPDLSCNFPFSRAGGEGVS